MGLMGHNVNNIYIWNTRKKGKGHSIFKAIMLKNFSNLG